MRNHYCWLLTLGIFLAGACKKKSEPGPTGDFQPMTSGSSWTYAVTGTSSGSFTVTATDRDTSVNSRTFRVFTNTAGPNKYYNKTGSDYPRFSRLAELNNQSVELLYLKDNLNKGQSWVEVKSANVPITGLGTVPVTARFTFTVTEKGISRTVNGTAFTDVLQITAVPEFSAVVSSVPVTIPSTSNLQYFYARRVGLINSLTALEIPLASISSNTETRLTAYTIK